MFRDKSIILKVAFPDLRKMLMIAYHNRQKVLSNLLRVFTLSIFHMPILFQKLINLLTVKLRLTEIWSTENGINQNGCQVSKNGHWKLKRSCNWTKSTNLAQANWQLFTQALPLSIVKQVTDLPRIAIQFQLFKCNVVLTGVLVFSYFDLQLCT